jgi:fatty acid desaturase
MALTQSLLSASGAAALLLILFLYGYNMACITTARAGWCGGIPCVLVLSTGCVVIQCDHLSNLMTL